MKEIVEKSLIVLSFLYYIFYLCSNIPIYFNSIYLFVLTIFWVIYYVISKMKLEISSILIFSLILLIYACLQVVVLGELEYKKYSLCFVLNLIVLLGLISPIFYKHKIFVFKSYLFTMFLFYAILIILFCYRKIEMSWIIEQYFYNSGVFAVFVTITMIIGGIYVKELKFRFFLFVNFILLSLSFVCALFLASRTSILILTSYTFIVFVKRIRYKSIKKYLYLFTAISFILVGLTFFIKKESTNGRFFIWKTSFYMVKEMPVLFGIGYNNFPVLYPKYQSLMYKNGKMSKEEIYLVDNTSVAFNEYLQIMIELGLIGLLLFILIIGVCIYHAGKYLELYIAVCIAMIVSYLLHSTIIVYVLLLNLALVRTSLMLKFSRKISVIIFVGLMILSLYMVHLSLNKIISSNNITYLLKASPEKVNKYYSINKKFLCEEPVLLFKIAEYNYNIGNIDMAFNILKNLDHILKNDKIELLRGKCFLKKGNWKLGEEYILLSISICPNRFINRYELFKVYQANGLNIKAIEVAKEIFCLKEKVPSIHTSVIKGEIENFLNKNKK